MASRANGVGDAVVITSVTATGLGKRYGDQRALAGVDLALQAGEVTAVLGHNGAGKSTLVRPTSGTVRYQRDAGVALDDGPALRREIGLLAHASLCYADLSAVENLRFFAELYDVDAPETRIAELLDQVGLEPTARIRPARTYSRKI